MNERQFTITYLATKTGITAATLRTRARKAGFQRTGRDYILTPAEAQEIIYYRPVGRPRKGDQNDQTSQTASVPQVE